MRRVIFYAMVRFLVGVSSMAKAELILSLTSSTDPLALPVGHSVTFYVNLSGLSQGQDLDLLAATIKYNGTFLTPSPVVKGAIIPSPLNNNSDFLSDPNAGLADATFSTSSTDPAHHISNNGVFFSFDAQVTEAGVGDLSFDVAYANPDPNDPSLVGQSLHVATSTPEPSTWVLLGTAALAAVACCLARRTLLSTT